MNDTYRNPYVLTQSIVIEYNCIILSNMEPVEWSVQQQHDINASSCSPSMSVGLAFWSVMVILIYKIIYCFNHYRSLTFIDYCFSNYTTPKDVLPSNCFREYWIELVARDLLYIRFTLWWRHNGRDGVSNQQPHNCLLNRLLRSRSKKTSKLRATGLWAGKSPVTGEVPAQKASNAENISIWWRHYSN